MRMSDKQKTSLILDAITQYYTTWGRDRSNIMLPELRLGSGYCGVSQRRIDAFIINSANGNTTTSYEIKVSKQDFKHDVENDLKQRGARLYSNYFYYVTPKGLLTSQDIPLWAGLLEIDLDYYLRTKDVRFDETVPAPLHSKGMPSWGLICSIIRHINKDINTDKLIKLQDENKKLKRELDSQKSLLSCIADGDYDPQMLPVMTYKYRTK